MLAEQLVSEFQGFVHRVDGCRKVHALGKTAVEFRHQNELRFLLRPRNGESFVGADLEVFFKLVLNGCRRRQAIEGFFEFRRTGSFNTFGQENDYTALLNGAGGIVHGLLHLIDIDVFWPAAAGSDDEIGLTRNLASVYLIDELTGFFMSFDVVAGEDPQELVLSIKDGVQKEERASLGKECDPFHLVVVAGVAFH